MEEYKITSHSDNETIAIAQNIESEKNIISKRKYSRTVKRKKKVVPAF